MADMLLSVARGEPAELRVTCAPGWQNLTFSYKGKVLATFAQADQLRVPKRLTLPDGRPMVVQIAGTGSARPQLRISVAGVPVNGIDQSAGDAPDRSGP